MTAYPTVRDSERCHIVPPYLLHRLEHHPDPAVSARARATLVTDVSLRAAGRLPAPSAFRLTPGVQAPDRTIHDAEGTQQLPGRAVRSEGDPDTGDIAVTEAYDGLGSTWELFFSAFGRNSLDGSGMPMLATVHFGQAYANAFWDGRQMVFGDGDGQFFNRFTAAIDVIGHELAHGVTELTAGLLYRGQSGALNESVSDVFGSLVKQWVLGQDADEADWLIGEGLFTEAVSGSALRSMSAPGTAYDDEMLGSDPQPGHMEDFVVTADDNGGVHINSGIPNRAFHLAAVAIGGRAWERAGQVWYDVLTGGALPGDADFTTFAAATVTAAEQRFGTGSAEVVAILQGWRQVGLLLDDAGVGATGGAVSDDPAGAENPPDAGAPAEPATPAEISDEVYLGRSGGFAGITRECTFRPSDLEQPDAGDWSTLIVSGELPKLAEPRPQADSFSYRVVVERRRLDITLGERALPEGIRDLIERTLREH